MGIYLQLKTTMKKEIKKWLASVLFNWCLDLDPEFFSRIIDLKKYEDYIKEQSK